MNEEEIQVFNFNNKFKEEYQINKSRVIEEENLEKLILNQTEDKNIINTKVIERFIIFISVKLKNELDVNNKNIKEIQLNSFNVTIIKYFSKNNENQEVNINIPIKGEINIPIKDFYAKKFYFFDLVEVDEQKSFFFLYIFNQLHVFKLYQKEDQLKYNKIKINNFNSETTVLYIGNNFSKEANILEIELLLKPLNCFYYIQIDIKNETKKLKEKEYKLEKEEYSNIFNKFIRSNCGIFLFIDKKANKKYIVSTGENKEEIIIKELNFNSILNGSINELKIIYLYKIIDKLYIIAELIKKEEENKYMTFGIFEISYIETNNNYSIELLQQIKIQNNEGIKEYNFNINISNFISFNIGEKVYFIHLDQNGIIDMINLFQIKSKELNILRYYYDKSQELSLFIFFKKKEIFISKFPDEFDKSEKYLSNENKNEIKEEIKENNQKEDESIAEDELINLKSLEKNQKNQNNLNENNLLIETNNMNIETKNKIEKIILERIEFNKKNLNNLIDAKIKKIKALNKEIKLDKEENKKLKFKYDEIKKVINKIKKMKNDNNNYYDEEEAEEDEQIGSRINYNYNYKYNNNEGNLYQMGMNQSYNNQIHLINQMNNPQQQNLNYNYQNYSYNNNQINPQFINQFYQ